jgi:hypothetical protein
VTPPVFDWIGSHVTVADVALPVSAKLALHLTAHSPARHTIVPDEGGMRHGLQLVLPHPTIAA